MEKLLSRIWQLPSRARKRSTVKCGGRAHQAESHAHNCTKMGVVLLIKAQKQPPPLESCTRNKADTLQFDAHRGEMASFVIIFLRSSVWFVGKNFRDLIRFEPNQLAPHCDICNGDGKTRVLCQPIGFLVVIP